MNKLVALLIVSSSLLVVACKKKEGATSTSDQTPAAKPVAPAEPAKPAPAPPPPAKTVTGDDLAKRYVECWGYFSAKDWDNMKTCYAPNIVSESVDSGMPPVTGWNDVHDKTEKPMVDAFPDVKGDVELTLINGKNGVTVALLTGTHSGTLKTPAGDVPATNKKFGLQVAHAVHFVDDGKSVDKEWFYQDMGELMSQLGLSKAPARAASDKPWGSNEIVVAKNDDAEKKNVDVVKAADDAFNKHDAKAMDALIGDDLVWSEIGMAKDWNKKEASAMNAQLWKGFSDIKFDVSTIWGAGDYVVEQGTMSGTNDGPMPGMGLAKKTGKPVKLQYLQVWKIKDGKVSRSWGFWNSLAFAGQLGLVPPPPAAAPAKK